MIYGTVYVVLRRREEVAFLVGAFDNPTDAVRTGQKLYDGYGGNWTVYIHEVPLLGTLMIGKEPGLPPNGRIFQVIGRNLSAIPYV